MDYERGLRTLKTQLPAAERETLAVYESRLLENLHRERLFGSTETVRSERANIVYELNRLAQEHLHVSYNDLCQGRPGPASDQSLFPPGQAPQPRPTYTINIEHAEGLAIGDGARVEQGEQPPRPESPAAPPAVSIILLTRVVPTAYCYHLDAAAFPLVTVKIDNTGRGGANSSLRVSASIEGYSDTAVTTVSAPQGQLLQVQLLPVLKPEAVAGLNDIRPATLRVTVEQITPLDQALYDQTTLIRLHARDTALLAVQARDGSIVDLTKYLAAWVTPRRPEIERLLRKAAEHHPERCLVGYQGASALDQAAEVVRKQAQAIFTALKEDADLVYINSPLSLGAEEGQVTQRVRFPAESLAAGSSANCIDGAVLFASLLELAAIDPFIVVIPGHAFVGWRVWRSADRCEFLETTMIASDDFAAAQQSAQELYEDAMSKGYFGRGLFDPGGFARLIDIRACRNNGIYPLE